MAIDQFTATSNGNRPKQFKLGKIMDRPFLKPAAFILACLFVFVAVPVVGQTRPQTDVTGWNGIRWGMTPAEAKAGVVATGLIAETVEPLPPDSPFENSFQSKLKLGSVDAVAVVESRKPDKTISRVVIRLGSPNEHIIRKTSEFGEVKNMLQEKYGAPTTHDRREARTTITEEVVWNFPSTTVTLVFQNISNQNFVILAITYEAVNKSGLDRL